MTENSDPAGGTPTPPAGTPPPAGVPPYPYSYPPSPAGPPAPGPYTGAYPGAYPPPPMPYGDPYAGGPTVLRNGLGIAALIFALLALFGSCSVVFGLIFGVVAVILGVMARGRVRRGEANNGGVATAGLVLGALAVVLSLAFIAVWMGVFKNAGGADYFDCINSARGDNAKVEQCTTDFQQRLEDRFGQSAVTPG